MDEESPGHRADLAAGFAAGSRLGGYRLEEQVGSGGMAVVFRARDVRLDRLVALKIMAPAMGSDDMFRQRFIRESRAAAAVEDPHIIPVYEAGEAGQVLFIAMRLVRGGDVRSLLRREGPLSPEQVASIISPVASALDAAHAAGLVHRDVKPANILLDRRPGRPDHVYLSDFGLSKSAEVSLGLTAAGQFLGTPDYTAPEQIEGLVVDGRTDQYALACAAFELLSGQAPFHRSESFASIWAHLNKPPPSLTERRPGLPAAVELVMTKALAKAQTDRYQTCWEFADALRDALGLTPYHVGPASDPGLARPGSTPGEEAAPGGAAWAPPAAPVIFPYAEPGPGPDPGSSPDQVRSPAAAAGMAGPPPGEDTEASEIYAARSSAPRWGGQPAMEGQESTPDDQATDPGLRVMPPDPARVREQVPSPPRQQPSPAASEPRQEPGAPASEPGVPALELTSTPVPELTGTRAQEAARAPVRDLGGTPVPELTGAPAPEMTSAPAPELTGTPAREAARAPAQPPAAAPAQPRVLPRRPAPPGSWPSIPRIRPNRARNRPATPRKQPDTPAKPPAAPGRSADRAQHGRQPRRGRATYLALIGAGVLVAASVAVVLTLAVTAKFLGTPGGRRVAAPSAFSSLAFVPPPAGILSSVAFSPGGRTLSAGATGGPKTAPQTGPQANGITYLWDVKSGQQVAAFSPGGGAEAFSPDGTMLAAAGGPSNSSTYLWDLQTRRRIATLSDHHDSSVEAVAFSANGRMLAADDTNGAAYVWMLSRSHRVPAGYVPASVSPPGAPTSTSVAFSPTGTTLAIGGSDGQAYLWNPAMGNFRTLRDPGSSEVTSLAFSPNGQALAASETDGVTYVWDLPSRRRITLPDPDSLGVDSMAFSPDSTSLATGDTNGKAYVWNLRAKDPARTPAAILTNPKGAPTGSVTGDERSAIFSVAFSPGGTTLATTDTNGHVYLWKVR